MYAYNVNEELSHICINNLNFCTFNLNEEEQKLFLKKMVNEIINSKSMHIFVPESVKGCFELIEKHIMKALKKTILM